MVDLIAYRRFPPDDPITVKDVHPIIARFLRTHLQYFTPRECKRMLAALKLWGLLPGKDVDPDYHDEDVDWAARCKAYPAVDVLALLAEAAVEGVWP